MYTFIQTREPAITPPHLPSYNSVLKIINIRGDKCLKLKNKSLQFTCINISFTKKIKGNNQKEKTIFLHTQ